MKRKRNIKLPEKFTIYKDDWKRGDGDGTTMLDYEGMKCPLGFLARAAGCSTSEIREVVSPQDIPGKRLAGLSTAVNGFEKDTAVCDEIIVVNDNADINDKQRERRLRTLFGVLGVKVSFRSGSEPWPQS